MAKKSKKQPMTSEQRDELRRECIRAGHDLAIERHENNWSWGKVMRKQFGDSPGEGRRERGLRSEVEKFRQEIFMYHNEVGGIEGFNGEAVPSADKLIKYRKMSSLFPRKQRHELSMTSAEFLVKHVPDPEVRGDVLDEVKSTGELPTATRIEKVLINRSLIKPKKQPSVAKAGTRKINNASTNIGSLKLDRDKLTEDEAFELDAELQKLELLVRNVRNYITEPYVQTEDEIKPKKRRAA